MTTRIPTARVNATDVIRHLIGTIEAEIAVDAVCVCSYDDETDVYELLAHDVTDPNLSFDLAQMQNIIRQHIRREVVWEVETLLRAEDA